jgi:hypothetical protein
MIEKRNHFEREFFLFSGSFVIILCDFVFQLLDWLPSAMFRHHKASYYYFFVYIFFDCDDVEGFAKVFFSTYGEKK